MCYFAVLLGLVSSPPTAWAQSWPGPSACLGQTGKSPQTQYWIVQVFADFSEAASCSRKSILVETAQLNFISHSCHLKLCHHGQNISQTPVRQDHTTGTEQGLQSSLLNSRVRLGAEDGCTNTILGHPPCRELGHLWKPKVFLYNHHHVIWLRIFPVYRSVSKHKTDILKFSKVTISHPLYLIQRKVALFLLRRYIQNGTLPHLCYTPWSGGPRLVSLCFYCSSQPVPHPAAVVIQRSRSDRSFTVHWIPLNWIIHGGLQWLGLWPYFQNSFTPSLPLPPQSSRPVLLIALPEEPWAHLSTWLTPSYLSSLSS